MSPDLHSPVEDEGRVLRAIEKVDDRLRDFQRDMAVKFEGLSAIYMPRDQLQDRFESISQRHQDLATDIQATNTRIETTELRHSTTRRFVVTTSLTALGLALTAISVAIVLIINLHH